MSAEDSLCNDGGQTLAESVMNDEFPYIKCRIQNIAKQYSLITAPHLRKELGAELLPGKERLVAEMLEGFLAAVNQLEDFYVPLILEYQWAPETKDLAISGNDARAAYATLNCKQYSDNRGKLTSCKQVENQIITYLHQTKANMLGPITRGYTQTPKVPSAPTPYGSMPVPPVNAVQTLWEASRRRQKTAFNQRIVSQNHETESSGRCSEYGYRIVVVQTRDDMMRVATSAATIGNGVVAKASTFLGAGTGLFAAKSFARGEFITQFSGDTIGHTDAKRLESKGRDTHVAALRPGVWYVSGLRTAVLEDQLGQGGGSYANDNIFRCETLVKKRIVRCSKRSVNAELVVVTTQRNAFSNNASFDPKMAIVMLVASDRISLGNEILVKGRPGDVL